MPYNWELITQDFKQKYEGTYCYIQLHEKNELFYLEEVEARLDSAPYLRLTNNKFGNILVKYTTEQDIDFSFPNLGVFQYNNSVLILFRNYLRQWKKGACNSTLNVIDPYAPFIYNPWSTGGRLKFEILENAFKPRKYVKLSEALKVLKNGTHLSIALSETFFIGLSLLSDKSPILWYLENPIGVIENETIVLYESQFQQELEDFLNHSYERTQFRVSCRNI